MLARASHRIRLVVLSMFALLYCGGAAAAELKIGLKSEPKTADPHEPDPPSRNVIMHVLESLVGQDDRLQLRPQLAVIWRPLDDTTWEFKLRPGVSFHDGSKFTSEDVKFSIERALNMKTARTYRTYLKDVASISTPDPNTVVIKTKVPSATLPQNLSSLPIVSAKIGKDATNETFASGKAMIGTGPYKYSEWAHGERVVLVKNDHYWDVLAREPWDKVTFQFIPKDPARASALLAGAVDVIDSVSSSFSDSLSSPKVGSVPSVTSSWMVFVQFDQFRNDSPYVKDNDGKPLGKNPFMDRRVRKALSYAINREAIVKRVMKGDGEPAGQMVAAGFFGHNVDLKPDPYDLAKAKNLLKEAGYPNGFRMTLHCSNDRYAMDAKVCEALGQMFTQAGVKTEVQTSPFAVFQTESLKGGPNDEPKFSATLFGISAVVGEALNTMVGVVHSLDLKGGFGQNNRGRYSNKQLDTLIEQASRQLDEGKRRATLQAAAKLVVEDSAILPIHFEKRLWATRKGITVKPRSDGFALAMNIREAAAGKK